MVSAPDTEFRRYMRKIDDAFLASAGAQALLSMFDNDTDLFNLDIFKDNADGSQSIKRGKPC